MDDVSTHILPKGDVGFEWIFLVAFVVVGIVRVVSLNEILVALSEGATQTTTPLLVGHSLASATLGRARESDISAKLLVNKDEWTFDFFMDNLNRVGGI